jgi:hypothetical protein
VRANATPLAKVERVDSIHVLRTEFEVEERQVGSKVLSRPTAGSAIAGIPWSRLLADRAVLE